MPELTNWITKRDGEEKKYFWHTGAEVEYQLTLLSDFLESQLEPLRSFLDIVSEDSEFIRYAQPCQVMLYHAELQIEKVLSAIKEDVGRIEVDLRRGQCGREDEVLGVTFTSKGEPRKGKRKPPEKGAPA